VIANAARPPLLERDREIRKIVSATKDSGAGCGRLFVVEGPAGIGRSRLLLEIAHRARRGRTVVIVDDVQRTDRVSEAQLARHVAAAGRRGAVVVIARRAGALPLRALYPSALRRDDRSIEIVELRPLSQRAVAMLLEWRCGIVPDSGFAAACHVATAGNPALVDEFALALKERAIAPVASSVGVAERLALAPIGRAVLARLAPLGPAATALVMAGATLGDGTRTAHAVTLADIADHHAAGALAALCRDDVLMPGDRIRFTQPLVRRSILAAVRPSELSRWHRHAADLLEAVDAPCEAVAAHLLRVAPAGDRAVVGHLRLSAHRARQVGDRAEATAHLRRACEEGVPEFQQDLALELAELCAPAGD
jgi:hypothetical protein